MDGYILFIQVYLRCNLKNALSRRLDKNEKRWTFRYRISLLLPLVLLDEINYWTHKQSHKQQTDRRTENVLASERGNKSTDGHNSVRDGNGEH